jgi:FeS assembly SUF system regulator
MIRLSRLSDYGIVLMTQLAVRPGVMTTAPELALTSGLPVPTVSKVLKLLAQDGLLGSQRGTKGGYMLGRPAAAVTVADIIRALEGPIALTECTDAEGGSCEIEPSCPTRTNWRRINDAVIDALEGISLSEMTSPGASFLAPPAAAPNTGAELTK